MSDQRDRIPASAAIDAVESTDESMVEYQRLIKRFDLLWESAPSPQAQQEMQQLLASIEQYEIGRQRRDAVRSQPHQSALRAAETFSTAST